MASSHSIEVSTPAWKCCSRRLRANFSGVTQTGRRQARARLDALGPALRAGLLYRADAAGLRAGRRDPVLWGNPKTRNFGESLIDCEEG